MPGDFSRTSVNPPKHYSGVLMQQGRVQVDADWNEQLALQHHRTFTETRDVVGRCGTPKEGNGFLIDTAPGGGDLLIGPGRFYVHGLLCEIDPQRVAIAFPAAAAAISPPSFQLGFRKGFAATKLPAFQIGLLPHFSDPQGQVNVPSLSLDDRNLCVGDWVEVSASGVKPLITTITAIGPNTAATDPNSITPNYYTLTLNDSVYPFQNAPVAWLRRVVTFITQPFLHSQLDATLEAPASGPSGEALELPDGDYLVTLEAWQREVDALEDPHIREVALGGPDTAVRLQTAWQVHVVPYGIETPSGSAQPSSPPSPLGCCTDFPGWDQYKASLQTTGYMNAQAPPPVNVPPCQLPPAAGYLGLANQLYRVEIFQSGEYNQNATFVFSRDNAMVETGIVCVDSNGAVYVNDLGKDDLHSLALNDWVEVFDRNDELLGTPRFLAQITSAPALMTPPCAAPGAAQSYNLTLTPAATQFSGRRNLCLRRWDMPATGSVVYNSSGSAAVGIPIVPGWIQLENNIYVNFTGGYYATRSFWQIPARTATGDIEWPPYQVPNTNPIPQPPMGVNHYFCRLATLTVSGRSWMLADCRNRFPSLTDICADDVCYHGDGCELQPAGTVQEAIEELGARIRYHNKMLHGSGVVCGYGVTCSTGTTVQVKCGYAIDCDGNDLILKEDTPVDFSKIVELSPSQSSIPDGDYELIIEKKSGQNRGVAAEDTGEACCSKSASTSTASCVQFRAIECKQESLSDQILHGTLLFDFYEKCLKTFGTAFQQSYTDSYIATDNQVTKAQALTSSLTNLFYQSVQPTLGKDVYISQAEHQVLEGFYNWLASQLHNRTSCELNNLAAYPAYNVAGSMTTIFGKGFSTRLRVDPTGERAFAVGSDYNIYVYDLKSGQLASVVAMPSPANTTGWIVQDVTFNENGNQIYAIATTSGNSWLAIGTLANTSITWTSSHTLGAIAFNTMLLTSPSEIYAVAAGQGLYAIPLAQGAAITQVAGLATPVGHLVANTGFLYLTANSGSSATAAGKFNIVQEYEIGKGVRTFTLPAGVSGDLTDDILFAKEILWVTATSSSAGKELFEFRGDTTKPSGALALNDNTTVRLAYNNSLNALQLSFEDKCQIQTLSTAVPPAISVYCPTEVNPNSIAIAAVPGSQAAGNVYALNSTSNTISVIPANMAAFTDYADLEAYRNQALTAFVGMLGALLQNLKDCFCDLFIVHCPTCDPDSECGSGVALCCVTIKNGSVCKICNLEKRKYVKSFPTVEYWLSLIPVIPLVRTLFERFCCLTLPSLVSSYLAPSETATYNLSFDPATTRQSIAQIQNFKLTDAVTSVTTAFSPIQSFAADAALSPFRASSAAPTVSVNQVIGQPVAAAQKTLQASNIGVVAVSTYDPTQLVQNVAAFTTAPASLPAGSSVTLVADQNGNVKYYIPSPPAVTQINATVQANQQAIVSATAASQNLQTQIQAVQQAETPVATNVTNLQNLVTNLQAQLATMQTANAAALALRDQEIANLNTSTQQLQVKLQNFDQLTAQVKELTARLPGPATS